MTNISKTPFIKWTGSKRKQAPYIVDQFPNEIETYYEPFLGGGSVLHELLNRIYEGKIKCNKIVCSDLNCDLISLFNMFISKEQRNLLFEYYSKLHYEMKNLCGAKDKEPISEEQVRICQKYYNKKRDEYNEWIVNKEFPIERAMTFYWIARTSFNGLIRYNPNTGKFNSPFHVAGRLGITPEKLKKVFDSWALVIDNFIENGGIIEFYCQSYDDTIKNANKGDVIYMDPPYENTLGMYYMIKFDSEHMYDIIELVSSNGAKVLLSYDGYSGENDNRTANVRKWYIRHVYVESGHSSFKKLKSKSVGTAAKDMVKDSLYINY